MTVLYVDGGCSKNNQPDPSKRQMVAVVTDAIGGVISDYQAEGGSNNVAELMAVADALLHCVENQIREVEIRTDSRNNLAWVLGKRLGKNLNDKPTVQHLKDLITSYRTTVKLTLTWVPREKNLAGHYIESTYSL